MKKTFLILFIFCSFNISIETQLFANWIGTQIMMTAPLGDGLEQIRVRKTEDLGEVVPEDFVVLEDGKVVINTFYKKIFDKNGFLKEIKFEIPKGSFFSDFIYKDGFYLVLFSIVNGEEIYKEFRHYDYEGNVRWTKKPDEKLENGIQHVFPNGDLLLFIDGKYQRHSATLDFIETYSTYENAMGKAVIVSEGRQPDGSYLSEIEIEKTSFKIKEEGPFTASNFKLDNKENLLVYAGRKGGLEVAKYDRCGKKLGSMYMPESIIHETPKPGDPYMTITTYEAVYGLPVFYPSDDFYTTFRNETEYKILKWAWVDSPTDPKGGPDAPLAVQALPSTTGVYLTWSPSPQDPGCVTGYDIERSTSATGIFSSLTTVPPKADGAYSFNDEGATAGATWYYKVKAKSEIGDSDPAGASAARP